jgi:hypothetical protein
VTMRNLLIDDMRDPKDFPNITRVARDYAQAIDALQNDGPWDMVWFDHDLGEGWQVGFATGYDVMCWLEKNPQFIPKHISLCTQNAVGREKMKILGCRLLCQRRAAHDASPI